MSLTRHESRAFATPGGFFKLDKVTILEARSIFDAVLYAESKYPPGCL